MNRFECTRRTLAAGDLALVEQCSCGSVHVTIGAVTMRLSSSAIPSIAMTLGDAARSLVLHGAFVSSSPRTTDVLS